ncbi:hypothetical protein Tco_0953523 [Tanacetum coccineum]|uniref:Uncharacterized protein n=1 Tax=Tanacetum coccineum TaxID=301880 RepID=A0ABQ5E224_9ASTR
MDPTFDDDEARDEELLRLYEYHAQFLAFDDDKATGSYTQTLKKNGGGGDDGVEEDVYGLMCESVKTFSIRVTKTSLKFFDFNTSSLQERCTGMRHVAIILVSLAGLGIRIGFPSSLVAISLDVLAKSQVRKAEQGHIVGITSEEEDASESFSRIGIPKNGSRIEFRSVVYELLGDDASWSTVVEEGEPVDVAGSGATTLAIGAITSGAGKPFSQLIKIYMDLSQLIRLRLIIDNDVDVLPFPFFTVDSLWSSKITCESGVIVFFSGLGVFRLGLGVSLSRAVGFLRGILAVVVILVKGHAFSTIVKVRPVGCDPLALLDGFTPVDDNIGVSESNSFVLVLWGDSN